MKKKSKFIIFICACVLVVAGIATGLIVALNTSSGHVSSTIVEETTQYGWKKHSVHIEIDTEKDTTLYSTNNEGDYIYNIEYSKNFSNYSTNRINSVIHYQQNFKSADDLDTFFVLSNGVSKYTTDVLRCRSSVNLATIVIPLSDINTYDLDTYYISEIWLRTID